MKTTENKNLTAAGKLLGELKVYEKDHWDNSVVAWTQDDRTLGVVGMVKDKDGDLRIEVEEVEEELEGIWSIVDVIDSLENCDKDTRVYLAGHGLYFAINGDGCVFSESDDDDVVGCNVAVFGGYEEEKPQVVRKSVWKERKESWKGILEGVTFLLCIPLTAFGLYYNFAALVKHSRPVWECALWIPILALLLWVCIENLFSPEHNK